ncbi:hypothetical protein L3V82_11725 [Thiotrichales bacterium 19S3-7]|nr:hypothetical protein [Thiotrichales bacterium 19S3-7]MCF6802882.1 hypothetical protein [Thiotrichales bacterium 19S3-11]
MILTKKNNSQLREFDQAYENIHQGHPDLIVNSKTISLIIKYKPNILEELIKNINTNSNTTNFLNLLTARGHKNWTGFQCIVHYTPELLDSILDILKESDLGKNTLYHLLMSSNNYNTSGIYTMIINTPQLLDKVLDILSMDQIINALNLCNNNYSTGWSEIATRKPEFLSKCLSLVQTDEQKSKIINSLCLINNQFMTGLLSVAGTANKNLLTIFEWVKELNLQDKVIDSLCILNNDGSRAGWMQIVQYQPQAVSNFLSLAQTKEQYTKIINSLDRMHTPICSGFMSLAYSQDCTEGLKLILNWQLPTDTSKLIFNSLFPYGFSVYNLLSFSLPAQTEIINFIARNDSLKETVINKLNEKYQDNWTGWMQLAQSKPERLPMMLSWAKTSDQQNEIIKALCIENQNNFTGLMQIAYSKPKCIRTLLNWAHTKEQQTMIIQALSITANNDYTGFKQLLDSSANDLVTIVNWKNTDDDKNNLFKLMFPKTISVFEYEKLPLELQTRYNNRFTINTDSKVNQEPPKYFGDPAPSSSFNCTIL